ncbi:MAG: hypothetical protein M0R17_08395 [Candidatus Omnitrophica bacterium]|jgi:hypothetical protein|nr:hypothetical protein [Candidatus Omnitrophota bacterium]
MSKQEFTPRYYDLTFDNIKDFNKWLGDTTKMKIHFVDQHQDLLKIWTDEFGEILHCNLQASIWNGMFVNLKKLKVGQYIQFRNLENTGWDEMDFLVDNIIDLK